MMYKTDIEKCRSFALRVVLVASAIVLCVAFLSCGTKHTVQTSESELTDSVHTSVEVVQQVRRDTVDSVCVAVTEEHRQTVTEEVIVDVCDTMTEHLVLDVDTAGSVHLVLDRITTRRDNSLMQSVLDQYVRQTRDSARTQKAVVDSVAVAKTDSVAVHTDSHRQKAVAVTTQTWYEWLWDKLGVPFALILMMCAGFYAIRQSRDNDFDR